MRLWLGGYTADTGGTAEGIGALIAGETDVASAGGALAFAGTAREAASPSWLAAHPRHDIVYAALEGAGTIAAFARTGETRFTALGTPVEAGAAVCHVAVAPDGGSLVASCWGDGRVVHIGLDAAGRPRASALAVAADDPYGLAEPAAAAADEGDADVEADALWSEASDQIDLVSAARALRAAAGDEFAHLVPDYDRKDDEARDLRVLLRESGMLQQAEPALEAAGATSLARASRAHSAVFLPDGRVATTDLGFDLVRFWRHTGAGLRLDHEVTLPLGSGPRHMVSHPSGHVYVLSEYSCEVFVLAQGRDRRFAVVGGVGVSPFTASASAVGVGGDSGAELASSHDGEFLYAGLRGSNTIAAIQVKGAGEALAPVALVESGVDWPRHHLVVRDTLLVAGERSNDVVSLTLNIRTGVPGRVVHRTSAPSPTCILPARRR